MPASLAGLTLKSQPLPMKVPEVKSRRKRQTPTSMPLRAPTLVLVPARVAMLRRPGAEHAPILDEDEGPEAILPAPPPASLQGEQDTPVFPVGFSDFWYIIPYLLSHMIVIPN
jgi:hypothetical protein